jgi:hypothetical protein
MASSWCRRRADGSSEGRSTSRWGGWRTRATSPRAPSRRRPTRGSTSPRPWVAEYRRHGRPLPRISRRVCTMTRPGFRLCAFAARVCSARTMERWIDPLIADLHSEHAEMQRRGSLWRARSVPGGLARRLWQGARARRRRRNGGTYSQGSRRRLPVVRRSSSSWRLSCRPATSSTPSSQRSLF